MRNINSEKIDHYCGDKNAFMYACENERIELLKMMTDVFQISPE